MSNSGNNKDIYLKIGELDGVLGEHGKKLKRIEEKLDKLLENVSKMQGKASAWGSVAGTIGGALAAILMSMGLKR